MNDCTVLKEKLRQYIIEATFSSKNDIKDDTLLFEEGLFDSMGLFFLIVFIRDEFLDEINIEANTFKLKGPDGSIKEYTARNPENLKRSKVGDLVVITITEALAIVVEPGSAE